MKVFGTTLDVKYDETGRPYLEEQRIENETIASTSRRRNIDYKRHPHSIFCLRSQPTLERWL